MESDGIIPDTDTDVCDQNEVTTEIKFDDKMFHNFTKFKPGRPTQYLEYFFQPTPTIDSSRLRLTNISIYSTTPWKEANFISRAIVNFYKANQEYTIAKLTTYPIIITDATANVGGNTISFYLNGIGQVNAVEKDELTCQILKNNLEVYQLPTNTVYCCDYLDIYKTLIQDVVVIDAPWGGSDYKDLSQMDLFLSGVNIIDICVELMVDRKASLIVLKLPVNYNYAELFQRMPNCHFLTHKVFRGHNHNSYNMVFCW